VALLALLGALIFDHYRSTTNTVATPATATLIPTLPPSPTPSPTVTAIPVATPRTTKAGVAVDVNGEAVPMSLYVDASNAAIANMQYAHQDPNTGANVTAVSPLTAAGKKEVVSIRQSTLQNLEQEYVVLAYARKHHELPTQAEITAALSSLYSQYGGQDAFEQMIKSEGFTDGDVEILTELNTVWTKVYPGVTTNIPCKPCGLLHARQIVVGVKATTLANSIAKHLQADHGADFAAYAKKYSTDKTTASKGGDLGFVDPTTSTLDSGVLTELGKLKMSQVSSAVKATDGYHIIQLIGQKASDTQQQQYFMSTWIPDQLKTAVVHVYVQIPTS